MKFSLRLGVAVTLLLALFLSAGGTLLVRMAFRSALDAAVAQSTGQHLLEKYALEAEILELDYRGEVPTDARLVSYADSLTGYFEGEGRMFAMYAGGAAEIFSTLPADIAQDDRTDALAAGSEHCVLRGGGERYFLLMASRIDASYRELWLLSAFDVSALFTARAAQLDYLMRVGAVLLAAAMLSAAGLSLWITRPIKKLGRASRRIATGGYHGRTGVAGTDEIGMLARDFDAMAVAVEDKMEQLGESIRQRDDFVAAFTHEIKTPMTSLIGYSDILRSAENEPRVRQKAAGYIYHEAKRLESLSQKLLELMGLSDGTAVMREVSVDAVCGAAARSVRPAMGDVDLVLEGEDGVTAWADPELIADLLRNLILNAVKAEPKDGTVKLARVLRGHTCVLIVRDTGCGIPEEELGRVTEPFYMVDKSRARAQGGSGVGLALCNRIAQMHGGPLRFQSKVGVGTAVAFALPTRPPAEERRARGEGETRGEGEKRGEGETRRKKRA